MRIKKNPEPIREIKAVNLRTNVTECPKFRDICVKNRKKIEKNIILNYYSEILVCQRASQRISCLAWRLAKEQH